MPGDIFTWEYDAESGVYKNHALANKLKEHSALKFVVAQFANPVSDFGKKMGETYNWFNYDPLTVPSNPYLDEQQDIPLDTLTPGSASVTLKEIGRGVQVTSLSQELSKYDPESAAQKRLTEQMKTVMEILAATALKTAKICAISSSATAITWDTDGTPSSSASNNLALAHVELIRDYLVNTIHAEPYEGDDYVGIFTTKALRGLKGDSTVKSWAQYLKEGDLIYKSEIFKIENIRFVEVNIEAAFSNAIGTSNVTGEGVVFGSEALDLIEAVPPYLAYEAQDFGRFKRAAWRGVLAFGLPWQTANDREARVIRWTSS